DEDGRAGRAARPYLSYESPYADRALREAERTVEQWRGREATAREDARRGFDAWLAEQAERVAGGFRPWQVLQPTRLESAEGTELSRGDDGVIRAGGPNPRQD